MNTSVMSATVPMKAGGPGLLRQRRGEETIASGRDRQGRNEEWAQGLGGTEHGDRAQGLNCTHFSWTLQASGRGLYRR